MLKVGRKRNRKERKKEKKHTRSQGNKFRSLNVRINHATHRLKKKHFSRAVTNANKGKKSDFNRASIFCKKKLKPKEA